MSNKTYFQKMKGEYIMYIMLLLFNVISASLPFMVVVGNYLSGIPFFIAFFVFLTLSNIFPVLMGTVGLVLIIVGFYYAFVGYPVWVFVIYCAVCIPRLVLFAKTFKEGMK